MKVFVTGGTGFIGRYLVERLVRGGHQVHCLVRTASRAAALEEMGAQLFKGDVTDKASLLEGMRGCDWVANLANVYSFWEPDRRVYHAVNVDGTRNVMLAALDIGIPKVVHVSTAYVYGRPATIPFTEETPVGPKRASEYTRTKYAGDLVAWRLHEEKGLPLVVIYPAAVLGSGDPKVSGRYIRDRLAQRVPGIPFPDSVLTYVYVRDVAEAIALALQKEGNIGEKYLVGKHQMSNRAYSNLIAEVAGLPSPAPLSDWLTLAIGTVDTWLADLTKRPPRIAAIDNLRTLQEGGQFDGSKAERELGLRYTPLRQAVEEEVAAAR